MPTGQARLFQLNPTRSGANTRFRVPISCCKCPQIEELESARRLPDDVIANKFKQKGWLIARTRGHDVCPSCLGVHAGHQLAEVFKVRSGKDPVPTPAEIVGQAEQHRSAERAKLGSVLDRHFPDKQPSKPAEPAAAAPPAGVEIELLKDRLDTMARDIAEVRAAMELQVEQSDRAFAQGAQLIEAVARLTAMIGRSNENITSSLNSAASAMTSIVRPEPAPSPAPRKTATRQRLPVTGIPAPARRRIEKALASSP